MSDEKEIQYIKISRREAFNMLPMDKPVILSVEQQASLRVLINEMDGMATKSAFEAEAMRMTYGPP